MQRRKVRKGGRDRLVVAKFFEARQGAKDAKGKG